jgi:uncharacterized cupin superfamily protein
VHDVVVRRLSIRASRLSLGCAGTRSRVGLSKGDYATFSAANQEGVHQLVNSSGSTLRHLRSPTMFEPDVIIDPDSETIGVFVGVAPGGLK